MTTSTKISVTWAELLLVILLAVSGMGVWFAAEWLVKKAFEPPEPQEEDFQNRHHVPDCQRRVAMAEDEWKATHAFLVVQLLEVERQSARIEAFEREYREIQKSSPTSSSVPEETVKAYRDAHAQKEAAALLERRLQRRLEELRPRLAKCAIDLSEARRSATEDWKKAAARRARGRLSVTALLAAAGAFLLLLATRVVLGGRTGQRLGLRLSPVLGVATILLVILYTYQALDVPSAALGSLLLLVAVGILFRVLSSSDSSGAAS
jgi:hypothetical protein